MTIDNQFISNLVFQIFKLHYATENLLLSGQNVPIEYTNAIADAIELINETLNLQHTSDELILNLRSKPCSYALCSKIEYWEHNISAFLPAINKNCVKYKIALWIQGDDVQLAEFILNKISACIIDLIAISDTIDSQQSICINNMTVPFIPLNQLNSSMADYVILIKHDISYTESVKILEKKGFYEKNIISYKTICVPHFSFEKYKLLKESKLSILSLNCAGGIISHLFTLPFRSPFVNMFMNELDFLTLLEKNPMKSLSGELSLIDVGTNNNLGIDYPIFELNGFKIHMNHYSDFTYAKNKWYERMQRINWYNLLIIMYTDKKETLERFDKLPFAKKICFVPFESDLASAFSFNKNELSTTSKTWQVANSISMGKIALYDLWDILLYGKKTKLS
ncbi:Uncharacterized protein, DUF1919 family [Lachnospiraceae bacterium KH1T2]|nr:Uncharacterized protein, DUF1919 family [Lachnospiraceae bacterium KH1T2]